MVVRYPYNSHSQGANNSAECELIHKNILVTSVLDANNACQVAVKSV